MKYSFLIYLLMFFFCNSCSKGQPFLETETDSLSNYCNPILEKTLKDFIQYNDSIKKQKIKTVEEYGMVPNIYNVMFNTYDKNCYLELKTDFYYNKNTIKGYFFYKNNLIVYEESDTSCSNFFIKEHNLIKFRDSIPGFKSIEKVDMEYDTPLRIFKIINQDSVEFIHDGILWRPEEYNTPSLNAE